MLDGTNHLVLITQHALTAERDLFAYLSGLLKTLPSNEPFLFNSFFSHGKN